MAVNDRLHTCCECLGAHWPALATPSALGPGGHGGRIHRHRAQQEGSHICHGDCFLRVKWSTNQRDFTGRVVAGAVGRPELGRLTNRRVKSSTERVKVKGAFSGVLREGASSQLWTT
jgi:hypothetical protein